MRVWLQVRHMWEVVRYSDVNYYEDRWVLDAHIATVPLEMQLSLSKKQIAKEAWDAIAAACIISDRVEAPRPGSEDVPRLAPVEAPIAAPSATRSRHETTPATTMASLVIRPRSVDSHDLARPMSHRWRRRTQLFSWHMQALSYLQRHQPQWLSSTLMS
jgi:hypothetical protein